MTAALSCRDLAVRYGATQALAGLSLQLAAGRVHVLAGENGAGKTTLLKCLAGTLKPAAGSVARDPSAGRAGMLRQDAGLIGGMPVLHNLALACAGPARIVWRDFRRQAAEALERQGAQAGLDEDAADLSCGERLKVALARMDLSGSRIWLLDEPAAALTQDEAADLLARLRAHARAGGTAVVSTHRLDETLAHADEVHVLTRGRLALSGAAADVSADDVRAAMFPDAVPAQADDAALPAAGAAAALELHELRMRGYAGSLSLRIMGGEIVGLAGIAGNGQSELFEILAGLRKPAGGEVRVAGRLLQPGKSAAAGLRCILEDPMRDAAMPAMSIAANLILHARAQPPFVRSLGLLDRAAIRRHAQDAIAASQLAAADPDMPFAALSGGNRRKLVVRRELDGAAAAVAAHNPTAGLDAASAAAVAASLRSCCRRGAGILLCSEDLAVLGSLASRLLVIKRGELIEVPNSQQRLDAAARAMAA